MKRIVKTLWVVVVGQLSWGVATAADAPATPSPRELLGQYVDINRDDFKAKGKISLHRLQPLAGQLKLSEASGDPAWIFKTISPWNPGLARALSELNIKELSLTDTTLMLDGKLVDLQLKKAATPEGWVTDVSVQTGEGGNWSIQTDKMRLERMPSYSDRIVVPLHGTVGFDRMQASGNAQKGEGWAEGFAMEGWRVVRLEGTGEVKERDTKGRPVATEFRWNADQVASPGLRALARQVPAIGEILRFAGKNPDKQEPLHMDQLRMQITGEVSGKATIKNLRMTAPWVQIWGDGVLEPQGKEGEARLTLNLNAKNAAGKQKRFMMVFPIAALAGP